MNSKLPSFNQGALIAVLTLMMFGMQNAQAELIRITKNLERKESGLSNGFASNLFNYPSSGSWPGNRGEIELGSIKVGDGEELSFKNAHILSDYSQSTVYHGVFKLEIKHQGFGKKGVIYFHNFNNGGWNFKISSNTGTVFTGSTWPIMGPVEITIKLLPTLNREGNSDRLFQPQQLAQIFFEKKIASYAQSPTQLQAIVLPKNTKNTRLVVESSEDLVNWKLDTPGPKTTTNRERFFRLRAVKE